MNELQDALISGMDAASQMIRRQGDEIERLKKEITKLKTTIAQISFGLEPKFPPATTVR